MSIYDADGPSYPELGDWREDAIESGEPEEERKANYALVQEMAASFRERNGGSIVCRELLGLDGRRPEGPVPSERTADFYKKRPCPEIIRNAAVIAAEKMKEAAR